MQTVSRFIEAFAIVIVPQRNFSFEAVKFYLNTKCRYSDSKYMYMFIVKTIQWKYSKQSCQRHVSLIRQSWLSDYDSEQVLGKMSPEEYIKMSLIISSFVFNFGVFFFIIIIIILM